ncbi:FIVAR domain-containing protein [Mycoplasmoides gallisepticum]|uniref:FIVAR domain-containing protein n=1 Tax=Mycoplasmoides gallisepticum TaxID=2096 RepID=UPI0012456F0E|nr:FIVAR domain-containing protein [Mycoplasmoides gallisepticum]QEX45879.1 hypothetical protein F6J65_01925 [Mycoplasmoides gallisepticum]
MKRKNILKFVSLLGIGSFVMLAAASCTSATTPTPNPEPKPDPMPNPPSGGMNGGDTPTPNPNPPSGGMNGGDTNPGNGGGMDNSAQELTAAKKELSDLLATQSSNLATYADYRKIQDDLTKAYNTAQAVLGNDASTTQNLKDAKTALQTAIDTAASSKQTFDQRNAQLVQNYTELKASLNSEEATLAKVEGNELAKIKDNLVKLYEDAKKLADQPLEAMDGTALNSEEVTKANTALKTAINPTLLMQQTENVTMLTNGFVKEIINKAKITGTTNNQAQPGNYSFVGYSLDLNTNPNPNNRADQSTGSGGGASGQSATTTNSSFNLNWNFARRSVWRNVSGKNQPLTEQDSAALTDVSWIYSLTGTDAKYTLTFNWYAAAETGYLYFPYKLVKDSDKDKVALNYKLNDEMAKAVDFKTAVQSPTLPVAASAPAVPPALAAAEEMASASESSTSETMPANTMMNEAPTVDGINVAKVKLTGLKFGENTIDFSVPTTPTGKVAPMIGNMYLTSNPENADMIYNSIFGNSVTQNNAVTVDLLKGYGLAASYVEYIRQFTNLKNQDGMTNSQSVYLVGLINGTANARMDATTIQQTVMSPNVNGDMRTFTIYVNAPAEGDYSIKGSYLLGGNTNRNLKFSTSATNNSSLTINVKKQNDWDTLGVFDTAAGTNIDPNPSTASAAAAATAGNSNQQQTNRTSGAQTAMQTANKTIRLMKGLNKVIIGGINNLNTPFIGNLTFTLNPSANAPASEGSGNGSNTMGTASGTGVGA